MRPTVILNFALSADGKTGASGETGAHFTSKRDLERLWEHRRAADAVLVGRRTLLADHMSMTVPGEPMEKQPWRCVATQSGKIPSDHPFFTTDGGPRHLIGCAKSVGQPEVTVHSEPLVDWIGKQTFATLLCEGGGALARSLMEVDLVDEIHLTWAGHTLLGGGNAPTLSGLPTEDFLPESRQFELVSVTPAAAEECFLHYKRVRSSE